MKLFSAIHQLWAEMGLWRSECVCVVWQRLKRPPGSRYCDNWTKLLLCCPPNVFVEVSLGCGTPPDHRVKLYSYEAPIPIGSSIPSSIIETVIKFSDKRAGAGFHPVLSLDKRTDSPDSHPQKTNTLKWRTQPQMFPDTKEGATNSNQQTVDAACSGVLFRWHADKIFICNSLLWMDSSERLRRHLVINSSSNFQDFN